MRLLYVALTLALASIASVANAYQEPLNVQVYDETLRKTPSAAALRGSAARALKSIEVVIGKPLMLSCNRCKSGFALKVLDQALQKKSTLSDDQLADVERLRAEGQAFYNQEKYAESLEVLRKAQSILGIDASGDPVAPPIQRTSETSAEPLPNR